MPIYRPRHFIPEKHPRAVPISSRISCFADCKYYSTLLRWLLINLTLDTDWTSTKCERDVFVARANAVVDCYSKRHCFNNALGFLKEVLKFELSLFQKNLRTFFNEVGSWGTSP